MVKGFSVSVLLLFYLPLFVFPEGTRQIAPFDSAAGQLCIDKSRNNFGFFDAAPEFRINISVASISEKINFGLGNMVSPVPSVEVQYRLKDPAGNIVVGPEIVTLSGPGFISTYDQAVIGPFPAAGGYSPIQYSPTITGDYSLEFFYLPDSVGIYHEAGGLHFKFFDITVTDLTNQPISGRVWSKAWQFFSRIVMKPPTENRFWGKMFILSDDSIVTSVNCNGFVGGTFSFSSNKTGCSTTGNITTDRQSRTGFHTYPQYKVFLSDPDSNIFPTGMVQAGIKLPVTTNNDCATGSVDLGVKVNLDGQIEVFFDINPNPGADPEDLTLTKSVSGNPGGTGFNIIHWDGKDGKGNPVKNGTSVTATFRFIHGITHLPIYDIEYNDNGYKVEVVRPPGPSPAIYWDDSLLPVGHTVNLEGCLDISGCHLWSNEIGDTNTINSWWYVVSATAPTVAFTVKKTPLSPGLIAGDSTPCSGTTINVYSVIPEDNATSYLWSYSGTGALITGTGPSVGVGFSVNATAGTLSVSVNNPDCGSGPASYLPVTLFTPPQVTIGKFDSVCYTALAFQLTGGTPSGGEFIINGVSETEFDPVRVGPGNQTVVYSFTDVNGCTGSDSSSVFVSKGQACEIMIWFPDAFTPDGDGLNDIFRPVSLNIRQFSMHIYSRTGQLVFTSGQVFYGWDGTCGGKPCPDGNYVYVSVYESSVAPKGYTTLSGNITLVR